MNEFQRYVQRTVKLTALATALFAILWVLLPSTKPIFIGLTLGSVVSLYFAISTAKQAEMAADVALRQVRKRPSIVMSYRIAMVMAAVLAKVFLERKFGPGYVSLPMMVLGFFTYQFVMLGGFLYNKFFTSTIANRKG
ncbi:MAG TPA: hypothetical protein VFV52_00895 [Bacilli bacterium]|nr:hypothetical protein [Bacilli bacterium]